MSDQNENTTPERDIVFQRSKLLNAFYVKTAMCAAGQRSGPTFSTFRAGYGLVDETDPLAPVMLDIPANMQDIPNVFYDGTLVSEYSDGVVLCSCEIPAGSVSTPKKYSVLGIYDQDGDLVTVCTKLPDWFSPNESDRCSASLTFPLEYPSQEESDVTV